MGIQEIYIICTRYDYGQYVQTANTDRRRAVAEAERLAAFHYADGWTLTQRQIIPDAEQFDAPLLGEAVPVEVFHLKSPAGDWGNVIIYRVKEIIPNTKRQ